MFVVSLVYKVPLAEIDRLRDGHIEWLRGCYADGIFVMSGPKRPRTGGIILAKCSRAELDARLAQDPFAAEGAADYEVIEFAALNVAAELESFRET